MSRRSLVILLFASLALNLFVLGAVVGATFLPDLFHPKRPQPPVMAAGRVLAEPERQAYHEALSAQALAVRPTLKESRRLRRDAWTKLGLDPLDAAGVTAELDKSRALESEAHTAVDRKIVEFAAHLPATERAKLGQALMPPARHGAPGGPEAEPPPPPRPGP